MKNIPVRHIQPPLENENVHGNFSIRKIEQILVGKSLSHQLHRHDFFFVLALEKGRGKHEIDFTPYNVTNYSFFFVRPGQVHQLELKAGSKGYLMEFNNQFYVSSDEAFRKLLKKASSKNFCRLGPESGKKIMNVLDNIFREFSGKQESYDEVIKANLRILLIEYLRNQHKQRKSLNLNSDYASERVLQLQELLESGISVHKQPSQYAAMLNLSLYQLNAITRSALGKTCSALINEQIILESKRYLLATSERVNQIAYKLGYEDVSYFIRFFRKHTGVTPEVFRNNFK